jgi:hypothetical protein
MKPCIKIILFFVQFFIGLCSLKCQENNLSIGAIEVQNTSDSNEMDLKTIIPSVRNLISQKINKKDSIFYSEINKGLKDLDYFKINKKDSIYPFKISSEVFSIIPLSYYHEIERSDSPEYKSDYTFLVTMPMMNSHHLVKEMGTLNFVIVVSNKETFDDEEFSNYLSVHTYNDYSTDPKPWRKFKSFKRYIFINKIAHLSIQQANPEFSQ